MDKPRTIAADKPAGDMEFYLQSWMPLQNIIAIMKAEKKSDQEITPFIEQLKASRKRISKLIKKFAHKIEQKYGALDVPDLMMKGLKFAAKHKFTPAETEAFKMHVMKGDIQKPNFPYQEMEYTEMTKFLGFSSTPGMLLEIKPTDQSTLHEIAKLYEKTRPLHQAMKQNISTYRDCAPEAISGKFDSDDHNVSVFIHPIIVALFLPSIAAIEQRMLWTNVGRMVVHRASQYLRQYSVATDNTQEELGKDYALSVAIAKDPNSLNYFENETPITNLLKRFKIQIELWRNVLKLRAGKYYSSSEYGSADDAVTSLTTTLDSYAWSWFDSPEFSHVQDEGTILRKLLAVFSLRPTLIQISSFANRSNMGYSNIGAARISYINTPIVNVKLPTNIYGAGRSTANVSLGSALTQSTFFVEHKSMVPKNITVVHSSDLVFFYANRRYQSMNFTNVDMNCNYLALPVTVSNMTNVNETPIDFGHTERIGSVGFNLRSVTVLNKSSSHQFATYGCSTVVVADTNPAVSRTRQSYLYYNPVGAGIKYYVDPVNQGPKAEFYTNDPFTILPEASNDPTIPGFVELVKKNGTVFVYVAQ